MTQRRLPLSLLFLYTTISFGQWVQTNGPGGDHVSSLVSNDSTIISVNWGSGIYRSSDGGSHWSLLATGLSDLGLTSLAANGSSLFAGSYGSGVFLSVDNGKTWSQSNDGLTDLRVNAVATVGNNTFAGTLSGGFLSTDGGLKWMAVNNGLSSSASQSVYVMTARNSTLFIGTDAGVYRSTNNGGNWTAVNNGFSGDRSTFIRSLITESGMIVAGTWGSGIFGSSDDGDNWAPMNNGLSNPAVFSLAYSDSLLAAGTVYDGDASIVGVYLSSNQGKEWFLKNNGLSQADVDALVILDGKILAGTWGGGIFASTDQGEHWFPSSGGFTNSIARAIAASGSVTLCGTQYSGVYLSTDNGGNWTYRGLADHQVSALAVDGTSIVAGTGDGLFSSTDLGLTWSLSNSGLAGFTARSLAFTSSGVVAGTWGGGSFRSTDGGAQWIASNDGATDYFDYYVVSLMQKDPYLFAGLYNSAHGIFRSANGGVHWDRFPIDPLRRQSITSLASSGAAIYAGTNSGVYRSSDNGVSWRQLNNGLTNSNISTIATSGDVLVAGTSGGDVFALSLSDTMWRPSISFNVGVLSLASSGGFVLAGTDGKGLWRIPASTVVKAATREIEGPVEFRLEQNYPNPFNSSTTIQFSLPVGGRTSLRVFNILGEEIAALIDGDTAAGKHSIAFDASHLASGVYFYRVRSGQYVQTKKFVLVR